MRVGLEDSQRTRREIMAATVRGLAVVTGASAGIGRELACECARHGFDLVVAADRSLSEACRELESLGAEGHRYHGNLFDAWPHGDRVLRTRGHDGYESGK